MRSITIAAYVIGLALAIAIIAWQGANVVSAAFGQLGLQVFWLAAWFVVPLGFAAYGWLVLFPQGFRPSAGRILVAAWIGMSANWLLPVAQIGGDVLKGVWLVRREDRAALIIGSTILDKALQAATQALIAVIGVTFLAILSAHLALAPGALVFALVIMLLFAAFLVYQKKGLFARAIAIAERTYLRVMGRTRNAGQLDLQPLAGGAAAIDAAIGDLCARPRAIVYSLALRVLGRLTIAGEVWLVFLFLGHPISLPEALMIECLGQTVRAAVFFMPGAYGLQEGAYVLLAGLVGAPPEIGLTASLAKRVRELLVGLPALLALQVSERRPAKTP